MPGESGGGGSEPPPPGASFGATIWLDGADLRRLSRDDRLISVAIEVAWGVLASGNGHPSRRRRRARSALATEITDLTALRELSEGSRVTHHLQRHQRSEEAARAHAWLLWARRSYGERTTLGTTFSSTVRKSQVLQRRLPDLRRALAEGMFRGSQAPRVASLRRLYLLQPRPAEEVFDFLDRLLRGTGLGFVAETDRGVWIGRDRDGTPLGTGR